MARQYETLTGTHRAFVERQQMFFVASAAATGRVNVSPRGTDCFRIVDDRTVTYLDRTGSGNETAAHLCADGRLTVMFCAFEGAPMILRLYGRGRVLRRGGADYAAMLARHFDGREPIGPRQIVVLDVDLVQTSCGFGVPLYDHRGSRDALDRWAEAKGEEGLLVYQREKNVRSMDGFPTGLFDDTNIESSH
ncbi:pyridoxamine 5'-phosphate oxidase family protein [Rhodospira trueperi]|uniref:Pyridoxamine 5'-phosphate oxidase n=1 Tax=Rhodospira trueperi TaxID=69960 RepID=A0A1G7BSU4_9PROT|nr:pyridoxamine 5'-phosphate oxidase family protein [Rhodospira trueperi]SDE30178.1 Pyridoxamine 5'-phosphate oxidase [Rhodospira trueperi]